MVAKGEAKELRKFSCSPYSFRSQCDFSPAHSNTSRMVAKGEAKELQFETRVIVKPEGEKSVTIGNDGPDDRCEICGFTCRQKASLNWHMKKHDADSFYQFSCNICGKKFEKKDSVVAHKAKSHPEVLIAEALAANAGALITSTDILGTNPESLTQPADGQGLPLLPEPLGNSTSGECLLLEAEGMSKSYCSGTERVSLMADGKIFVGSGSSGGTEGLVMNSDILGATTEVLIEDSDSTGP
ncbi:PREDICTED: E3 ubiquitin-protein ligase ZFP91-like [Galeopterus variegatus]|uniref:E3 ubiquitin-protein ligase ZFP91-like n=1 Tax=Galeopterus variegatus TaxID=482537 RepID=A0ABM0S4T3_GALVR|nr:PREDICTED: E3 ubiquitin-protein ligase ZFP91-like [Galeopterus variegatus]